MNAVPPPVPASIDVRVNGQNCSLDAGMTVRALVERLQLNGPAVAVEINELLVPRGEFSTKRLQPGDRIEIVSLAGGG